MDTTEQHRAFREAFGASLLAARTRLRLSQKEVARRAGLTQGSLSNYEKGTRGPSLIGALALAAALGVPLESLLQEAERGGTKTVAPKRSSRSGRQGDTGEVTGH